MAEPSPMLRHAGNKFTRYLRMEVLGFRSDIWRSNIVYGGYYVGRMSISALHRHNSASSKTKQAAASAKLSK